MKKTSLKKIKIHFANNVLGLEAGSAKMKLQKYDGSGDTTIATNYDDVGTEWTITTTTLGSGTQFYHAPSDWNLSAGDIYALLIKIDNGGWNADIDIAGAMILEENWNDQVSS